MMLNIFWSVNLNFSNILKMNFSELALANKRSPTLEDLQHLLQISLKLNHISDHRKCLFVLSTLLYRYSSHFQARIDDLERRMTKPKVELPKPTQTRTKKRRKPVIGNQGNQTLDELFQQSISNPATLETQTFSGPQIIREPAREDSNPPTNSITISTETHQSEKNNLRQKLYTLFGLTGKDLDIPVKKKREKVERKEPKYEQWDESIVCEKVERTRITDESQIVPVINEKREAFLEVMRKFDDMDRELDKCFEEFAKRHEQKLKKKEESMILNEDYGDHENDFEQPSFELKQSPLYKPLQIPDKAEFSQICGEKKEDKVNAFFDLMEKRQKGEVKLKQENPANFGAIKIERTV